MSGEAPAETVSFTTDKTSAPVMVVLDPYNNDPTAGVAEDAVLQRGDIGSPVPIYDIIEAIQGLLEGESNDGCSEGLTVVRAEDVDKLRDHLVALAEW